MLKRILILDDNQDILEIVHETLEYEQFDVKSTGDGTDVMPLVEAFNPDLVILDYRVAGTNGGELCRQIKAHPKFGEIPVIIFSIPTMKNRMERKCTNDIVDSPGYVRTIKDIIIAIAPNPI